MKARAYTVREEERRLGSTIPFLGINKPGAGRETGERSVLLPMPSYHGTLAAVRCLGAAGIPVTVADGNPLVPALWSRFAARRVRCPNPANPARFMKWLLEFGAREPGHVLYPTSDDLAWLYSIHRDELAKRFVLRHPSTEVTYGLLNKIRLRSAAMAAGISMPRTWVPTNDRDLAEIAAVARFPVVIKPQTQILFHPHAKGVPVWRPEDLQRRYAEFTRATRYDDSLLAYDPSVSRATVQEYFPQQAEKIYGITGFIGAHGELFATRASHKILQQPRQLGVGLCFEEAEPRPDLVSKIFTLCTKAGYEGVFEAEFVADKGTLLLIDFNPRFYGQMAFDIARGLPLPLFAYDAALGRWDRVRERMAFAATSSGVKQGLIYCRTLELKLQLIARRLSGRISREESQHWWGWLATHRGSTVDAVADPGDRKPAWLEAFHHFARFARHPRSFVRQVVTD
jgi:predicted ATP-grasp superfamily ATP-dependent carboligase